MEEALVMAKFATEVTVVYRGDTLRAKNPLNARGEPLPIEVDGGINAQTITQAKDAGATRFVATSFLFNSPNPHTQFTILQGL